MLGFLKSLFGTATPQNNAAPAPEHQPLSKQAETSGSFDSENVGPFLHWINANTSLTLPEDFISDILIELPDIAVNTSKSVQGKVVAASGPEGLRLNIFMDDIDAPDLYFFGSEEVVAIIDAAILSLANENSL